MTLITSKLISFYKFSKHFGATQVNWTSTFTVTQRMHCTIFWITRFKFDSTFPLYSVLSGGQNYPSFQLLGSEIDAGSSATRHKYLVVSVFPGIEHKYCNETCPLFSFSVLLHDHNQDGSSIPRGYGWEGVCSSRWG